MRTILRSMLPTMAGGLILMFLPGCNGSTVAEREAVRSLHREVQASFKPLSPNYEFGRSYAAATPDTTQIAAQMADEYLLMYEDLKKASVNLHKCPQDYRHRFFQLETATRELAYAARDEKDGVGSVEARTERGL